MQWLRVCCAAEPCPLRMLLSLNAMGSCVALHWRAVVTPAAPALAARFLWRWWVARWIGAGKAATLQPGGQSFKSEVLRVPMSKSPADVPGAVSRVRCVGATLPAALGHQRHPHAGPTHCAGPQRLTCRRAHIPRGPDAAPGLWPGPHFLQSGYLALGGALRAAWGQSSMGRPSQLDVIFSFRAHHGHQGTKQTVSGIKDPYYRRARWTLILGAADADAAAKSW